MLGKESLAWTRNDLYLWKFMLKFWTMWPPYMLYNLFSHFIMGGKNMQKCTYFRFLNLKKYDKIISLFWAHEILREVKNNNTTEAFASHVV